MNTYNLTDKVEIFIDFMISQAAQFSSVYTPIDAFRIKANSVHVSS